MSASLVDSKRFGDLDDERAALIYVLLISRADVEGRLEVDDVAMLSHLGRYGVLREYSRGQMDDARRSLSSTGLWNVYGDPGNEVAEIANFHDHNKIRRDRESASTLPDPPREDSGSTPADDSQVRGSTPAQAQAQGEVQAQAQAHEPAAPRLAPLASEASDCERIEIANRIAKAVGTSVTEPRIQKLAVEITTRTNGVAAFNDRLAWMMDNRSRVRSPLTWLEAVVPARAAELTEGDNERRSEENAEHRGRAPDPSHVEVTDAAALRESLAQSAGKPSSTEKVGDVAARLFGNRET